MSKELTPLEALGTIKNHLIRYNDTDDVRGIDYVSELNIIETALKEKESIEKSINELFSNNGKVITTIEIKKQLKAYEIITQKDIDVEGFVMLVKRLQVLPYNKALRRYNKRVEKWKRLTKREFNLLKEVLL